MQVTEHPTKPPVTRLLTGLAAAGVIAIIASRALGVPARREVDWLSQLARAGDRGAQLQLGLAYRDGRYGLKPDPATGLYWLSAAARRGDAYAANAVGNAYANSHGNNRGLRLALPWWQLAARGGNADAQLHLGEFMLIKNHNEQAATLLRDAADRGDARARGDLASLYRDVFLSEADLQRGENRIAALGERAGSASLKTFFTVWHTIKAGSTMSQSSEALLARARHGDPIAEYQLAIRYSDGAWAVERNPQQAMTWLQRAVAAGNPVAAKTLMDIRHSDKAGLAFTPHVTPGASRT